MTKTPLLIATNLSCHRNGRILFSDLNFSLYPGQSLLLTGVNGSGKTSLLRIIIGLLNPHAGQVFWQGKLIQEVAADYHRELVYVGHKIAVKSDLTVLENLQAFTALHKMRADLNWQEILAKLELNNYADVLAAKLSAGQRQRLALSRLLLSEAKLWVLDEPFTALDQSGIEMLESWLAAHMQARGVAIIAGHQLLNMDKVPLQQIVLSGVPTKIDCHAGESRHPG